MLILAELLWFLLACPCARFERRGRKRETVFRCTQKTLEALGHAVVLPLVLLAVGFLVLEAMRLDGSESDAPVTAGVEATSELGQRNATSAQVVAWWAAGVAWSYVIWFPVKLGVQFNLCVGDPPQVLRPLKIGRWAAERRRAARNALSFGDADDDLDDVEEPWRVFEQP